jgi:hypothetical protein
MFVLGQYRLVSIFVDGEELTGEFPMLLFDILETSFDALIASNI